MAINIFSGGASKGRSRNSASASTRAAAAKAALARPGEVSSSGTTAVGTSGTLQKVGNFVGSAANIASKFLPGVGGVIAKGVANLLNDPEWWQTVPGDAVTVNSPLRLLTDGTDYQIRPTIVEFITRNKSNDALVLNATDDMITQYLMPEIRKVVNAIPLQEASAYATVLQYNSTIYAVWRTLKKWDYMLKHGATYIASTNDAMFPMLQVKNSAQLQAAINRLEEHLRANVRLPHTLCEYLAWRFGRIYRSNSSAKAAYVMYNPISLETTVDELWTLMETLMAKASSTPQLQAANADLYNTYFDHEMMVEIRDDTQMAYDPKEFCLRTNLDILGTNAGVKTDEPLNTVFVDSSLDNPTVFMASTVSTMQGSDDHVPLFPVWHLAVYIPKLEHYASVTSGTKFQLGAQWASSRYYKPQLGIPIPSISCVGGEGDQPETEDIENQATVFIDQEEWVGWSAICESDGTLLTSDWWVYHYDAPVGPTALTPWAMWPTWGHYASDPDKYAVDIGTVTKWSRQLAAQSYALWNISVLKPLDIYNKDIDVCYGRPGNTTYEFTLGTTEDLMDVSSLSCDLGIVTDRTIGMEHVYAFANLVAITRKTSMSYGKAEKLVARDTANLVEKLDIATAASK